MKSPWGSSLKGCREQVDFHSCLLRGAGRFRNGGSLLCVLNRQVPSLAQDTRTFEAALRHRRGRRRGLCDLANELWTATSCSSPA